ncbi:MAG: thioredoxin family protein [Anaerolineales bacterium]|nr:thioredoxin family protein [Anaerolineales bacterium]MCB9145719.1 thioredoxin family protein [Anaerolineales bacterium]
MTENNNITVYGADWCGDCRRAKKFFNDHKIEFTWINTDENPEAEELVKQKNNGKRIIPTIIFPDGSMLVEPSNEELAHKFGV